MQRRKRKEMKMRNQYDKASRLEEYKKRLRLTHHLLSASAARRKNEEPGGESMENVEDEQNKGGWRRTMKKKGDPRVSFRRWTLLCGGRKLAVAGGEKIGA